MSESSEDKEEELQEGGISVADVLKLQRAVDSIRPAGHKQATGCTGKRNRAAFVPLDAYSESTLASDFQLLEEANRAKEAAGRTRPSRPKPYAELPAYLRALVGQARSRGVTLEIQQPGMSRRVRNSSRWEGGAARRIGWRLEWEVPAAGATLESKKVPEISPTRPLLEAHLAPAAGSGLAAGHRLRRHAQAGADSLVVLMRRPHTPANAPQYWRIDLDQPLGSQLAGRTLVEFPTFIVLLPEEYDAATFPPVPPPVPPPRPPPGTPPSAAAAAAAASTSPAGGATVVVAVQEASSSVAGPSSSGGGATASHPSGDGGVTSAAGPSSCGGAIVSEPSSCGGATGATVQVVEAIEPSALPSAAAAPG